MCYKNSHFSDHKRGSTGLHHFAEVSFLVERFSLLNATVPHHQYLCTKMKRNFLYFIKCESPAETHLGAEPRI